MPVNKVWLGLGLTNLVV